MITQKFTEIAEIAAKRYDAMIVSWRLIFERALSAKDFGSPRQFQRVREEAYAVARDYLSVEGMEIGAEIERVSNQARRATLAALQSIDTSNATDAVSEHVSGLEHYLRSEIAIQIERDIAQLMVSMQRAVLQVKLIAESHGVSGQVAQMQYRFGDTNGVQFFFYDRAAAKWSSRRFIRSIWRQVLLATYNETVLLVLADHGEKLAQIHHMDPSSRFNDMIIAMSSGSSHPTYLDVRAEIFHPNADAIVRKVS